MAVRIGPAEVDVLNYLAANPRSHNIDMVRALQVDESNISKRLRVLREKEYVIRVGKRGPWSLTSSGAAELIKLGGSVRTILLNYWYSDAWAKSLKEFDDVLTEELPFWANDRDQIMGKIIISLDALRSTELLDDTTMLHAVVGVFKSYLGKKYKAKKLDRSQAQRVYDRFTALGGGEAEVLKKAREIDPLL